MTTYNTRKKLPPVESVDWPREARRLADYILDGDTKKSVALAGRLRLWTQDTGTEIRVGRHGNHTPLRVINCGRIQRGALKKLEVKWRALIIDGGISHVKDVKRMKPVEVKGG